VPNKSKPMVSRRDIMKFCAIGAGLRCARGSAPGAVPVFDGKSLAGWVQVENGATALSRSGILDPAALARQISSGLDPVTAFLRARMPDNLVAELADYSASRPNAKDVLSDLVKQLNQVISGPSIYDKQLFLDVALRPETRELLHGKPSGPDAARLNKLLLEDAYPAKLAKSSMTGWVVKDGAMASTGAGRGVIYTEKDYGRFRLLFTMRHLSGNPDHQACVLIFCARPKPGEKPLDALGGIQFQVPNGGHWDYRPGMNNDGGPEFTTITKTRFDPRQWSQVEILADAGAGTARMAVAQPPGTRAVEVLDFKDPAAGRPGPFAWQMHNAGLFDEYKDVTIEADPQEDALITAR
jgi:3-keto-disaccharide hydrolase